MYISSISFKGYKNSKETSQIYLNKGLNVLLGENGSGKTTVINALRLLLREPEAGYAFSGDELYWSLDKKFHADEMEIDAVFSELTEDEKIVFMTWCDADFDARLHLKISENKSRPDTYKRKFWGGRAEMGAFEEDTFDKIECVYLPPLRDAEVKLSGGRRSRLAYVLKRQYATAESEALENKVKQFNSSIAVGDDKIKNARDKINKKIEQSLGAKLGQSVNLQFSETSFNKIIENIRMVFFPHVKESNVEKFRDLATNSLGYNNLLYIATVFSELDLLKEKDSFTAILIEEPEAHLHPQLQVKFIKYIQEFSESNPNAQIVITTHSPVLASSVKLDKLIHIKDSNGYISSATLSRKNFGDEISKDYVERWLDVTKSTMLFSRGVILVEGIAESLIVPKLAEYILLKYNKSHPEEELANSLEEAGVSIININGLNFRNFMKLFGNFDNSSGDCIPIVCAGITDCDPEREVFPEKVGENESKNPVCRYIEEINATDSLRLYMSPLKTFEYDVAMQNIGLCARVLKVALKNETGKIADEMDAIIARHQDAVAEDFLAADARKVYERIESVGKGIYAYALAENIDENFIVPDYIRSAVLWACGVKNE